MKHKSIALIATSLVLLAASCNNTSQPAPQANLPTQTNPQNQTPQNSPVAQPATPVQTNTPAQTPASNSKTLYANPAYKVILDYTGLPVQTNDPGSYIPIENYFPDSGKNLFALYLQPSLYKGTNLESAWFNLAVNAATTDQAGCYTIINTDANTTTSLKQLRKVQNNDWHYSQSLQGKGGAAAGHSFSAELYRLFKNNTCYEVDLGLSDFNRDNLDNPNSVKAYDATKMFNSLGAAFNKLQVQ